MSRLETIAALGIPGLALADATGVEWDARHRRPEPHWRDYFAAVRLSLAAPPPSLPDALGPGHFAGGTVNDPRLWRLLTACRYVFPGLPDAVVLARPLFDRLAASEEWRAAEAMCPPPAGGPRSFAFFRFFPGPTPPGLPAWVEPESCLYFLPEPE